MKDINKYNIKVGDYVETNQGGIGRVSTVVEYGFHWIIAKRNDNPNAADIGRTVYCEFSDVEKYYKRIGENDFSKNKDELKPIEHFNDLDVIDSIYDKINELINHVNTIQERFNEYDSTRTN